MINKSIQGQSPSLCEQQSAKFGRRKLLLGAAVIAGFTAVSSFQTGCRRSPDAHIVALIGNKLEHLDPQKYANINYLRVLRNIYEPLVTYDAEMHIQPCLATDWTRVDANTLRFKLRAGVKFHDGEDFNSDAVWYTFYRLLHSDTNSPVASIFSLIDRVERLDSHHVDIVTHAPDATLVSLLASAFACILPSRSFTNAEQKGEPPFPIGTGPYQFVSQTENWAISLKANHNYWNGPPEIEQVLIKAIPGASPGVGIPIDDSSSTNAEIGVEDSPVSGTTGVQHLGQPGNRIVFFSFDLRRRPFDNILFRQAINYGANFEGIIKSLLAGDGVRVATLLNSWYSGFEDDIKPIPFEPDRAKVLVRDSGHPDGNVNFNLYASTSCLPGAHNLIASLVTELSRIGCKPDVIWLDSSALESRANAGDLDGMVLRVWDNWTQDADYSLFSNYHSSAKYASRWQGYRNEALDRYLEEARLIYDAKKRASLYSRAQRLLQDDCPSLFGYAPFEHYQVADTIDWTPRPDSMILFNSMSFKR
jgi:peptide/nickel transport system substrate-binding protein